MEPTELSTIKYVTINIDDSLRSDLVDIAANYSKVIGVRRLSMNDLILIMVKQFKEGNQLTETA